ncbi:MAG TPA: ribose 5-phosphate isomerase B [bacterium]|nr:ribose 5-phosphate isomerase B [bacterium]
MKILVASDHGGFELKSKIVNLLKNKKIQVEDLGSDSAESVDYPDYAIKVAERISKGEADAGILVCGTGIGMCIAANKFKGVRAAVVSESYSARMAKEHNNANVLCIGGRVLDPGSPARVPAESAEDVVTAWLDAKFEGGRHDRRLDKIRAIEKTNFK